MRALIESLNPAAKWDAMSPEDRVKTIHKDKSMRGKEWKSMVDRLSKTNYAGLSGLQKEMVGTMLEM